MMITDVYEYGVFLALLVLVFEVCPGFGQKTMEVVDVEILLEELAKNGQVSKLKSNNVCRNITNAIVSFDILIIPLEKITVNFELIYFLYFLRYF